jgi:cytochrome c2
MRWSSLVLSVVTLVLCGAGFSLSAELPEGDRDRGRRLFDDKGCVVCHTPPGKPRGIGPALAELQRPQGLFELAGRLWNHAPAMHELLEQRGQSWPALSKTEMADLAAWLSARPGGDRRGSASRGQALLLKKECLKCHAFFGEGTGVGPDLSRYPHYGDPLDWVTSVWNHAPKMRAEATRLRTGYPRFDAGEMVDLLEFLRMSVGRGTP